MSSTVIGYANLGATSTITSSSETSGFADDNAVDYSVDDWWKPTASPATITFDLGSAQSVDYIGVAGSDFGSRFVVVSWRYSTDNFSSDDNEAVTWTPTTDDVVLKTHTTQSERYWRLQLTYTSGPDPSIGHISFGARYSPPVGMQPGSIAPRYAPRNTYINGVGESGLFLGRTLIREQYENSIDMNLLTAAQMRTDIDPLIVHALKLPFFFNWDNTNYPAESAFVWLVADPEISTASALHHSVRLSVRGIIYGAPGSGAGPTRITSTSARRTTSTGLVRITRNS